jgi:hypothetical protein
MPRTAEERRDYHRAYYQANKEKRDAKNRAWREANPERVKANKRAWHEANKEKRDAQSKAWREANPERTHRYNIISSWRKAGVVCDDFEGLYDQYLAATNCADCGVEFEGEIGDGLGRYRCLDHCHDTGAFRDVVCVGCNNRRGFADRQP